MIYQHIKGIKNIQAGKLSRTRKPLYESGILRRFFKKSGVSEDRHVCVEGEYPPGKVSESATGSKRISDRCIPAKVAEGRTICVSTLEINTSGDSTNKAKENKKDSTSDTLVYSSILVPNANEDEKKIGKSIIYHNNQRMKLIVWLLSGESKVAKAYQKN